MDEFEFRPGDHSYIYINQCLELAPLGFYYRFR